MDNRASAPALQFGKYMTMPLRIEDVTTSGLCMGCGACHSVLGAENVALVVAEDGLYEPVGRRELTESETQIFNSICPGVHISVPEYVNAGSEDSMWGPTRMLWKGYASDPVVRFKAASGGALTALCLYVLETGLVDEIVHLAPDPDRPLLSKPHRSSTRNDVLRAMGSRYSPSAPLSEISDVLADGKTFAFVGKPCDVTALKNLSRHDARVEALCKYTFTIFCGGFSELGEFRPLLERWGICEADLSWFRYRGHGCPGQTAAGTKDGRSFGVDYWELWGDEASWKAPFRCRVCPDGIGLSADIAVLDCFEGADPKEESDGWNAFLARTEAGEQVLEGALAADYVTRTEPWSFEHLEWSQPHQSRRRRAAKARFAALSDAGLPVPSVEEKALVELSYPPESEAFDLERSGTAQRIAKGANRRPKPKV